MRTISVLIASLALFLVVPAASASVDGIEPPSTCVPYRVGGTTVTVHPHVDVGLAEVGTDPISRYVPLVAQGRVCVFEALEALA